MIAVTHLPLETSLISCVKLRQIAPGPENTPNRTNERLSFNHYSLRIE
jgi:hypothetical protein